MSVHIFKSNEIIDLTLVWASISIPKDTSIKLKDKNGITYKGTANEHQTRLVLHDKGYSTTKPLCIELDDPKPLKSGFIIEREKNIDLDDIVFVGAELFKDLIATIYDTNDVRYKATSIADSTYLIYDNGVIRFSKNKSVKVEVI